jgi:hypothetical protein
MALAWRFRPRRDVNHGRLLPCAAETFRTEPEKPAWIVSIDARRIAQ